MISYYTRIIMNEKFNQDVLFDMVIQWLETTRNKMDGLIFDGKLPFYHESNKKRIVFDTFEDQTIYAVQFITTDNRKNAQFVVEAIYHTLEQYVDLYFNKELTETSQYIPGTNIPGVFKQLLTSDYVLEKVSDSPKFISYSEFKQTTFTKPTIVLGRNQRCCISPFELSKNLLGLSEVICVPTKQAPYIKLIDFDGSIKTINYENDKRTAQKINELLVLKLYQHFQPQTYDLLVSHRLHTEHQSSEQFHKEMISEAQQIVDEQENSYAFLKEYYDDLLVQFNELSTLKDELDSLIQRYNKAHFLIADTDCYKEEESLMMDLLKQELMRLNNGNVYRRKHIVEALMEVNGDEY